MFTPAQDITVQIGYWEWVVDTCNHAGAERVPNARVDPDAPDEDILVCDRCPAYFNELSNTWERPHGQ